MNEILENLQNPVPIWLFLLFLFLGFAGFNSKSDKRKTKISNEEKSVFDQLYGEVRLPKQFEEDLSEFSNEEQKELKKLKYVRQFLNLNMRGLWCVEQVNPKESYTYGVLSGSHLLFHIYHGEKRVGELGLNLYPEPYESKKFSYELNISLECYWLEAHEVRSILMRLCYMNDDGTDEYRANILEAINEKMDSAIWNKLVERNMNFLEGINADGFWMRPLEIYLHGTLDMYFETIKDWEKNEQNPFELEKEIFEDSNQSS